MDQDGIALWDIGGLRREIHRLNLQVAKEQLVVDIAAVDIAVADIAAAPAADIAADLTWQIRLDQLVLLKFVMMETSLASVSAGFFLERSQFWESYMFPLQKLMDFHVFLII